MLGLGPDVWLTITVALAITPTLQPNSEENPPKCYCLSPKGFRFFSMMDDAINSPIGAVSLSV